jgi:co-chaperonin GroES (HSP10)
MIKLVENLLPLIKGESMRYCGQIEPFNIVSSQFKPLGGQFLGQYIMETESEGGILMPEQDTWWAKVIRVGPRCTVKVGEKVLMHKYKGDNVDLKDGKFTVLNENDALCAEAI